jgi:signal transduction histidine kinase
MSDCDMRKEERRAAAAQVDSDPAFAGLQASGAPIIAATADPLRIVYANPAALAVFGADLDALGERLFGGDDPRQRRLSELVESVRHRAAPRLERLHVSFGSSAQTVTILCRHVCREAGPSYFVIAALGVRPAAEADAVGGRAQDDRRTSRFLWRTDASGRFVDVTHVLADVVGAENADLLGREAGDALRKLRLDREGRLERALAEQKSWSGIEVDWPLGQTGAHAPTTLGGFPIFDEARRFAGFQGYGVLHLDRIAAPEAIASLAPEPGNETTSPEPYATAEFSGANVVPLRPLNNTRSASSAAPDITVNPNPPVEHDASRKDALTPNEQNAFEEIARALSAVAEMRPAKSSVRDLMQVVLRASKCDDDASHRDNVDAAARHALAALEQLPVGVLVARGAEALYANRALLDYLGYSDVEALNADGGLGRVFFGSAPKDFARGAPLGAIEVLAHDGEKLDVDACVQAVEWDDGLATLITFRRAHEQVTHAATSDETTELQAVLDATSDAIAFLEPDGCIRAVNCAFAALFGVEPAASAKQSFLSFVTEDDQRLVSDRIASFIANNVASATLDGGRNNALRIDARTLTGAVFPADLTFRRTGSSSDGRICVALRDLTRLRRSNKETESARLEAERASAAKSDFLAKVSHEIRTPLNAIIGFAEVMMEERFGRIGNERYKEYLKDVHASGTHVLSLVNDLLDLSKIEAGKFELELARVDANAIVSECVSIMQAQAGRARVVMRLSLSPRLPRICADSRSLKQILLNLLSNAVKFNQPGGQVIVSSALTDAGYVMLRVKDTGVGMSEEEIKMALEPFRQIGTARSGDGTGLGLPVTKALIEANQASFTIKSHKNEGTLVEIAFPPPQVLAAE